MENVIFRMDFSKGGKKGKNIIFGKIFLSYFWAITTETISIKFRH